MLIYFAFYMTGVCGRIRVTINESDELLCTLGYDGSTKLCDLRKIITTSVMKKDFVFTYPDKIRIHPRQERKMKVLTFGGRVGVTLIDRPATGRSRMNEKKS